MSFKRDGDDNSQLNVLKKRRVEDLLSNYIPEDEATLMKNGRYSCLVCSHRPIFDTVDILTVHRKGKRHLEGLQWFYGKKAKLQNDINKRRHQEYVNEDRQETGSSAPLLTQTRKIAHHALLRSTPYNSCHKKASEGSEKPTTPLYSDSSSNHSVGQNISSTKISTDTKPAHSEIYASQDQIETEMKKKRRKAANPAKTEPITEQRRRELEHYLKLKSNGWLQDPSGKWTKDENVEFDSDEEEPLPLLLANQTP